MPKQLPRRSTLYNILHVVDSTRALRYPSVVYSKYDKLRHRFFQSLIKDNYLPGQRSIYYSNYKSNVTIEWQDREKEIVKVTSVNHFKMVTESVDKFTVPWKSWTRVGNGAENPYSMQITKYKINDGFVSDETIKKFITVFKSLLPGSIPYLQFNFFIIS